MENPENSDAAKKRKRQWVRFNSNHKDTTEIFEVEGEKRFYGSVVVVQRKSSKQIQVG